MLLWKVEQGYNLYSAKLEKLWVEVIIIRFLSGGLVLCHSPFITFYICVCVCLSVYDVVLFVSYVPDFSFTWINLSKVQPK